MAAIEVVRIRYGWEITCGAITLAAENPSLERGVLRATLSVSNADGLCFRDTVNLTSMRARARVLKELHTKAITLGDEVLIALEEACRTRPAPLPEKIYTPPSPDFSGKVSNVIDLQREMSVFLLLEDPDVVPLLLGAFAAHQRSQELAWLLLVAPPSGTKTELIQALGSAPGVYFLSSLTARTLASGLDAKGSDPSLLARLTSEVLLLKDFTSVLTLHHDERQEILSQLRELYDGRYDKTWGTGKELHWQGHLGIIAGVTPVIDSFHSVLSLLGERFVMLRVVQGDRTDTARKALSNTGRSHGMRRELAHLVLAFLSTLPQDLPPVPETMQDDLARLADFVTRCRSGVVRDGHRREIEYAPEPEMPARFAKQLYTLLQGVALVCGHTEATQEDYDRIVRVARDCLSAARWKVLCALASASTKLTTTVIAQQTQSPTTTVRRALEDLQALKVVDVEKAGAGKPDSWEIAEKGIAILDTLKTVDSAIESRIKVTFPEKSAEGGVYINGAAPMPDVGDLVFPLSSDGSRIPDNGTPYPWLITATYAGADGTQYARFMESPTGWPITQCEKWMEKL